jgi:hypothetical protein
VSAAEIQKSLREGRCGDPWIDRMTGMRTKYFCDEQIIASRLVFFSRVLFRSEYFFVSQKIAA